MSAFIDLGSVSAPLLPSLEPCSHAGWETRGSTLEKRLPSTSFKKEPNTRLVRGRPDSTGESCTHYGSTSDEAGQSSAWLPEGRRSIFVAPDERTTYEPTYKRPSNIVSCVADRCSVPLYTSGDEPDGTSKL